MWTPMAEKEGDGREFCKEFGTIGAVFRRAS